MVRKIVDHRNAFSDLLEPTLARQSGFSFNPAGLRGPMPIAQNGAHAVADAIVNMLVARAELNVARFLQPGYTAQWSALDYVRDEQATYDAACNDLLAALRSALA